MLTPASRHRSFPFITTLGQTRDTSAWPNTARLARLTGLRVSPVLTSTGSTLTLFFYINPPSYPLASATYTCQYSTPLEAHNLPIQPAIMASPDMHETTAPASVESRRQHDTGFPEPFNGVSNTTLPHPEADLSPNAFISQDDLTAGKIGKRRSIRRRHKRTISHGRITPQMEAKYHVDPLLEEDEDAPDSMMDGTDGLRSPSGSSIHPVAPDWDSGTEATHRRHTVDSGQRRS
ncbi:hypothetical protein HYQ46_007903 [Verticillium longisporum]|nr:hypothetical protein HYQ46_007903 [Verticillium longisporum]